MAFSCQKLSQARECVLNTLILALATEAATGGVL